MTTRNPPSQGGTGKNQSHDLTASLLRAIDDFLNNDMAIIVTNTEDGSKIISCMHLPPGPEQTEEEVASAAEPEEE